MAFHVPDHWRIRKGPLASSELLYNNGAFLIPIPAGGMLQVIASDQRGWEHVSVSLPTRCPTWTEMCAIKDMLWDEDDCVVQYHPSKADYVNKHPFCLHLWRPTDETLPKPPTWMVG
jgi:hypothetical protein